MLRALRFVLVAVLVLAGVTAAGAYYVLQDGERLKPALETFIEDRTGVPVRIGGEVAWRLWPPVSLQAAELSADHDGQVWRVGALSLDLDLKSVLADPQQWRVQAFTLRDVDVLEGGARLIIEEAAVTELEPRRPAAFSARLHYQPAGAEPVPVTVHGHVRIDPDTRELALQRMHLATRDAAGVCDARVHAHEDSPAAPPAQTGDVLPVAAFLAYDWDASCDFDWIQVDGRRFEAVTAEFANNNANARGLVSAPRFFGGDAVFELVVEAGSEPIVWHLMPTLTNVDSQALLDWLEQELSWAAPLALSSELQLEGNNRTALLDSLSGRARFDGGQGVLDITGIRAQVLELARQFNEDERIARWPESWHYQRFTGDWRIQRQRHVIAAALDNLTLRAEGDYHHAVDRLDMAVELTFGQDPALPVFELNPLLYDLPIPLRCRGSLAEPDCRMDGDAAVRIVGRALAGGDNNELRATLEQKIDEQVPEQYRDAARALLDLLSGGDRGSPQKP